MRDSDDTLEELPGGETLHTIEVPLNMREIARLHAFQLKDEDLATTLRRLAWYASQAPQRVIPKPK